MKNAVSITGTNHSKIPEEMLDASEKGPEDEEMDGASQAEINLLLLKRQDSSVTRVEERVQLLLEGALGR